MVSFIVHISVLQSSGEADSHSATSKKIVFYETWKFITMFICKRARLDPNLSQMNPVHTLTTCSINSTLNG